MLDVLLKAIHLHFTWNTINPDYRKLTAIMFEYFITN